MVGKLTPDNMASASRMPQLLGLSPYATQNELLAEMIAHDEGRFASSFDGNELTYWGNIHEPAIIRRTAETLGLEQVESEILEPFFHPTLRLACSLDGQGVGTGIVRSLGNVVVHGGPEIDLTGRRVLIECKTTQAMTEDVPPPWRGPVQLQAQMMCTAAEVGVVAVLYRGSELRISIYRADPAMQERIANAVNDLESRRATSEWYPVVSSSDANVAWPQANAQEIECDDDEVIEACERLEACKSQIKLLQGDIADCESRIKEYMGEAESLRAEASDGGVVVVRWPMRNNRAQPEKVVPAKPASRVRQNTLTVKRYDD